MFIPISILSIISTSPHLHLWFRPDTVSTLKSFFSFSNFLAYLISGEPPSAIDSTSRTQAPLVPKPLHMPKLAQAPLGTILRSPSITANFHLRLLFYSTNAISKASGPRAVRWLEYDYAEKRSGLCFANSREID